MGLCLIGYASAGAVTVWRIDWLRRRVRAGALGEQTPGGGGHKLARLRSLKHVSAWWESACAFPPAQRPLASAGQTHRHPAPAPASATRLASLWEKKMGVAFEGGEAAISFVGKFGAFALKGNVIDLAVDVIIGSAFGKIVDAAVADLIMPLVGLALGGIASRSHTPTHPTEKHTPSCPPPSAHPFLSLPTERSPGWLRPGRESGGGESGQPR